MGLFLFEAPSKQQDGSAHHIPPTVVLQHAVEPPQDHEDARRKAGVPVPQEAPGRAQVSMTGIKLKGIKPTRPSDRPRLSLRHKKVFRAYGGVLSHRAVREKIVRAFLIEEQKIVNKVLKAQGKLAKE